MLSTKSTKISALVLIWNPVQGPSCEDLQETIEMAQDNDGLALLQLATYIDTQANLWMTVEEFCEEICEDDCNFPCNSAIRQMKDGEITESECFATCEQYGREEECEPQGPCNLAIRQMENDDIDESECFSICEEVGRELECNPQALCTDTIQQMATGDVRFSKCFSICEEVGRELECSAESESGFLVNGLSFVMFAILAILRN